MPLDADSILAGWMADVYKACNRPAGGIMHSDRFDKAMCGRIQQDAIQPLA